MPRAVWIARLFFGLLGTALCAFGAVHLWRGDTIPGLPLKATAVGSMLALAAFFPCNVVLQRQRRWPLWLVVQGLPLLFVVRIAFGA